MLQINFGKMAKLNISIPTLIPPRECIVKSSRTDFRKLDNTFLELAKRRTTSHANKCKERQPPRRRPPRKTTSMSNKTSYKKTIYLETT